MTLQAKACPEQRSLADLERGASAPIAALGGPLRIRRRLAELGLVPGSIVQLERRAPLGDPLAIRVREYQLSLRVEHARCVQLGAPPAPCGLPDGAVVSSPASLPSGREAVLALVGNPNAGKTSLFNALTGLRQEVSNYPGSTVERAAGWVPLPSGRGWIIDLPGIYSLVPASPDERIAIEVLAGLRADTPAPDVVIAVVDATAIARHLLLVTQILDAGLPTVVALTMIDEARARGLAIDAAHWERHLGVPVVPVCARSGEGLIALARALPRARTVSEAPWRGPGLAAHDALALTVQQQAAAQGRSISAAQAKIIAWGLLADGDFHEAFGLGAIEPLLVAVAQQRRAWQEAERDPIIDDIVRRYAWIDAVRGGQAAPARALPRDQLDALVLHPLLGPAIFALVMWALFMSVYALAAPLQDACESLVLSLGELSAPLVPDGWLRRLWRDGVVAGVGGVLTFVPQIAFLFLLLGLLHESGYLARGAFLLDRVLRRVGLNGRSFVPLLTAHACAIPAIMAARPIPDSRERLATMLVAPFMSCSARLPVYALLIAVCFAHLPPWQQGTVLAALYLGGILAGASIAWLVRRTLLAGEGSSFLLELPPYRWPLPIALARSVWRGVWSFVRKAGTIILVASVVLWAGLNYPALPEEQAAAIRASVPEAQAEAAVQQAAIAHSAVGRLGQALAPLLAPLGFDWQIGIGLIGAFAAREVFVSTLAVVYGVGSGGEDPAPLIERMQALTRPDGSAMWTTLTGIVVLLWFVLAMQCLSTVAVMVRESGGWRWPLVQLFGMNLIAYAVCLLVWQSAAHW
ncbi:MAG: ferrous iron transport protein B [Planctomycetota bacterium]|nr:ferrous iron transport protein B [Planctomycetota bacterium]